MVLDTDLSGLEETILSESENLTSNPEIQQLGQQLNI